MDEAHQDNNARFTASCSFSIIRSKFAAGPLN